jgi:hypothetical protein
MGVGPHGARERAVVPPMGSFPFDRQPKRRDERSQNFGAGLKPTLRRAVRDSVTPEIPAQNFTPATGRRRESRSALRESEPTIRFAAKGSFVGSPTVARAALVPKLMLRWRRCDRSFLPYGCRRRPFGIVSAFIFRISCGHGEVPALSFTHELVLGCIFPYPANGVERGVVPPAWQSTPHKRCLGRIRDAPWAGARSRRWAWRCARALVRGRASALSAD